MKQVVALFSSLFFLAIPYAHADDLTGSDMALVLGPSGIPTPPMGYVDTVYNSYLEPMGFSGSLSDVTAFTTPETIDFGPSIAQGVPILSDAIKNDYAASEFSVEHPLTVFSYSQSTVVSSLAEAQLEQAGIPSGSVDFVMVGDAASGEGGMSDSFISSLPALLQPLALDVFQALGWTKILGITTPDNDYPTYVFTNTGDGWAQWGDIVKPDDFLPTLLQGVYGATVDHSEYLAFAPADITAALSAPSDQDGLTDYLTLTQFADPLLAWATDVFNVVF